MSRAYHLGDGYTDKYMGRGNTVVHLSVAFSHPSYRSHPSHQRPIRRYLIAVSAAWNPHMPCTAAPGGVEEEQRKTPGKGVRYGCQDKVGRAKSCQSPFAPPLSVPSTKFGFWLVRASALNDARAKTQSRNPGAKRSSCPSIRSVASPLNPAGTWQYVQSTC